MSPIVLSQPSCVETWREAVRAVDAAPGHEAHNVILTIESPTTGALLSDDRVAAVDQFLRRHDKSVRTISNTIFPQALYNRHGAPEFFEAFHERVLPTVRKKERWSGYYFERMSHWPGAPNDNPLWDIVTRMRTLTTKNKYELALFDPARDIDNSPYGGQCLSFLSFKRLPGPRKTITLTALYRNHYYIEKLLGNLIGLGQLMAFVAQETDQDVGPLTIISSHATIDLPRTCAGGATTRKDLQALLDEYDALPQKADQANSANGNVASVVAAVAGAKS
ncbi:thymidylate synthase family protein [Roseovarius atlanticus]|uniref:hypothetical protein n=1 Tax=Roseovarius atlanticus TaxID=1641875 RepID=UPI0009E89DBD|nr:hypothetical protein [Roseovarius atlanticus]